MSWLSARSDSTAPADPSGMSPPPCPKRARISTDPCVTGAPWASLPEDLVELIGWRVLSAGDLQDYVRFRAVCAHWRRSAARPGGRGLLDPRFHPRRWTMLPEGHGLYPGHPALGGRVRFLNLSTGALARLRLRLPFFHDHVLLGCADGLLLLLGHRGPGDDTAVRLLHPFTGDAAELPPLSSLLPQISEDMAEERELYALRGFLLGVSAAVTVGPAAGAITVVLVLQSQLLVAHATTGDQRWTLSAGRLPYLLGPTVAFHGNLYAVTPRSRNSVCIRQIDPMHRRMPQRVVVGLLCHPGSSPAAHWLQLQAQSTWSNAARSSCLLASMMPSLQTTLLFTESPTS